MYMSDNDAVFASVVLIAVSAFATYWVCAASARFDAWVRGWGDAATLAIRKPLMQKGLGVCLLGMVPALVLWAGLDVDIVAWGLGVPDWQGTLISGALLVLAVVPVPFFWARTADMQRYYPQIRSAEWDGALIAQNGAAWSIYLLAYEFLFRGILVIGCATLVGPVVAVTVGTALAAATHMPKGAKETFATIPYGIVLGVAALETGSIWAGVASHVCLALSNDYWAVRYNPEMRFMWGGAVREAGVRAR